MVWKQTCDFSEFFVLLSQRAERFDRNNNQFVTIEAPQCILTYMKHMGYVDEITATWVGLESLPIAGLEHMLKIFWTS